MITGGIKAFAGMTGALDSDFVKAIVGAAKVGKARLGSGTRITGSMEGKRTVSGSITLMDRIRGNIGGE